MGCVCGARGERASLSTDLGRRSVRTSRAGPRSRAWVAAPCRLQSWASGARGRAPVHRLGAELQPRTWMVPADWLCVSM